MWNKATYELGLRALITFAILQSRRVPMAFHLSCLIFLVFLPSICMPAEIKAPSFKGEMDFTGGIINYANFIRFLNHKLNHSEVVEARAVRDEDECMAACTENSNCRSLNFKTTPDADGKHTCQILDADKFVSHDLFVSSGDFHHYSCTVCLELSSSDALTGEF